MRHHGSTRTRSASATPARTRRRQSPAPKIARHGWAPRTPAPAPPAVPAAALTGGRATTAERAEVDRMSRGERVAAMRRGRFSLRQLTYWSARYGDEVPLIGGEFAYIAIFDPEYCEATKSEAFVGVAS